METLNKHIAGEWGTSTIDIEFDSDYDGVEVFVPWCGIVHKTIKQRYKGRGPFYEIREYVGTLDVWNSGNWEVTDGYLTDEQELQVDKQVKQFVAAANVY